MGQIMTPRPLVRKHGDYWRIYVGDTGYAIGDYYTSLKRAADGARQMIRSHR